MTDAQKQAILKHQREKEDMIQFRAKKGIKAKIQKRAKELGKPMARYLKDLISADIGEPID